MGITTEAMRQLVGDVYDTPSWKEKVRNMPQAQVLAIFKDFLRRGYIAMPGQPAKKPHKTPKQTSPVQQLTLEGWL